MDVATILVLIAVVVMALAYVLRPFFAPGEGQDGRASRASADTIRRRATLLAERNRIYAAIRDLDFEHQTNKVSDEDYAAQRHQLVAQGVEVLQQLDALPALDETPAEDPIEAAIVAMRAGKASAAAVTSARVRQARAKARKPATSFCPNCGKPVQPGDLFCGVCGQRL